LQIAFDYVWQEAIDQGVLHLAQNAYETIVDLGGDPEHQDYQNLDPFRTLSAEGTLVLRANATPGIIVRDHSGESQGTRLAPPSPRTNGNSARAADATVRDSRTTWGDPSDPLNWSLDEFSDYVCCLKKKLTDDEFQKLLPQLETIYRAILANPTRNDDVLVVPTNSLIIEALPAEHTLLERFKLDHRMIDVKKAQGEARQRELDNVRMAARILSGERGDPHIDKKVLIEGAVNPVVNG
jgi:hypothetical protein